MKWTTLGGALTACAVTVAGGRAAGGPTAHARGGDSHVTGQGIEQTLDCNGTTLFVDGTANTINALGTCWAVTVMGSGNTVVADTVIHDVTVYGFDETVFFHNGDPALVDRGRELGLANRLARVPA